MLDAAFRVRYHGYVCGSDSWSLKFEMIEQYFDVDDDLTPPVHTNFTVKTRGANQVSRCCICDDVLEHFNKGKDATYVIAGQVTSGVREMRYTGRDSLIVQHPDTKSFNNKIKAAENRRSQDAQRTC